MEDHMLNLNVEVNIKASKPRFPISLVGVNKCLHCGAEGTLEKVDIFGRTSKQDIYPLDHIKCNNCGCDYSIKWKKVDSGELVPVPTNTSIKQEIVNTMNYLKIRKDGKKEI